MHRMAVGLRVDRDASDSHAVERADDAAGDGAAIGNEDLAKHVRVPHPRSEPRWASDCRQLQGLFSCGQFEISTMTFISASISTYLPGADRPSANSNPPSGVTGTFMKKLMLWVMSRFVSP